MIDSYKIKKINDEEILVIYLDINTEFSLDFFKNFKENSISKFIRHNDIIWNGTKVLLVVGGISIAMFNYNGNSENNIVDNSIYVSPKIADIAKNYEIPEVKQEEPIEENVTENEEIKTIKKEEIKVENKNNIVTKPSNKSNVNKPSTNSNVSSNNKVTNNNTTNKNENNVSNSAPVINQNTQPTSNEQIITVYRNNGTVINLPISEYLIGVVAGEMPASFNIEALKVQSIVARTYVLKSMEKGVKITDTVSTQRYIDQNEMKNLWGNSYNTYYNKIKEAVNSTSNKVIVYNNSLIESVYFSTSNGKTEDSKNVWGNSFPYLVTVDSSYDKNVSSYFKSITILKDTFKNAFGIDEINKIEIIERNESGRVQQILINDKIYTGVEVRTKLSLRSADFDIYVNENDIKIDTRGYGHGVGLSQYGSNEMAKQGYNYEQIIKHYYTGVNIINYDK